MAEQTYILNVIIILLAVVVTVSLFRKLRMSSILGYLIAGLVIGPYCLGFITDTKVIHVLGELGVVFLLFTIGLKMPLRRFQVLRRFVFGLGFLQVLITVTVFSVIAFLFSYPPHTAVLIGSALALSSTAVGLQLLSEHSELAQKHGRVSFAVLLFQDLFVVLLLVLLTTLATHEQSLVVSISSAALKAAIVLILIVLFGRLILSPIYRLVAPLKNAEIFTAMSILIVLLTSIATDAAGLSKELGAFLAGLLLSETEYRHQVESDIQPFYGLLLGLFFMSVGMSIDVHLLFEKAGVISAMLCTLLIVKAALIFGVCKLFKISNPSAVRVASLIAAGGEFAFVLLRPAVDQKLLSPGNAQMIYLVVAISMALTPLLVILGRRLASKMDPIEVDHQSMTRLGEFDDLKNHVIVAGFGRVGQVLCHLLTDRLIPFVAIDNDMHRISEGRARGVPLFYGDATRDSVWKSLGAERATVAVISLSQPKSTLKTALMVRRKFPHIDLSVRITDDVYEAKLLQAGVKVVKPENLEPSLQLATELLRSVGTHDEEIAQIIDTFRRHYQANPLKMDPRLRDPV